MEFLLEKIDRYVELYERKEDISRSLDMEITKIDLKEVIDMVKKSKNREKTISMFNEEIRKQIQELIDGGIL